ncbi:hypothetical protein ACH5RR_006890 [Cinchona calisaya]|uniref:Uncharacterized protein n=1 Tax=Cinchona calisaya TaxID=153742 RepID=A0ABD3AQ75_9GENT
MERNDTCDAEDELNNDVSSSSKAGPSTSSKPSQENKKRTRTIDILREEIKSIKEGLDVVAATLDRGNFQNYFEDQLYQEIEKVSGMSVISQMGAYQNLTEDVGIARAFLDCLARHRRLWLSVKYV